TGRDGETIGLGGARRHAHRLQRHRLRSGRPWRTRGGGSGGRRGSGNRRRGSSSCCGQGHARHGDRRRLRLLAGRVGLILVAVFLMVVGGGVAIARISVIVSEFGGDQIGDRVGLVLLGCASGLL